MGRTRTENHMLKIKIIVITIFCVLLITIIAGVLFYVNNDKNINTNENKIVYSKIKTNKSPQENFDNDKNFDYSVSSEMIYKNKELSFIVQNPKCNKYDIKISFLMDKKTILLSDFIEPGYQITKAYTNLELEKGNYDAEAIIFVYDENENIITSEVVDIKLLVK